ncbi:MAG: hypothetical protein J7L38_01910, partial [Thermoproteales archaeon]|nr:hypothetical protein [Thermoproteales archaeon]
MDKPEVVILRLIIVSALAAVSTYLLVIYTVYSGQYIMVEGLDLEKGMKNLKNINDKVNFGGIFMKVLVINCGSSSMKYKVFQKNHKLLEPIAWGIVEKIGEEISYFKYNSIKGKINYSQAIKDHEE